jgi:hypothetical protein
MSIAAIRAGILVAALVLAWRVLQVNLGAYDDAGRPRLPAQADAALAGNSDRAVLAQVLRDNPGQVDALLFLAREHQRAGDLRETRRAYQTAFELAPMDREVLGSGSEFFLRQGAAAEALAMLDRLVESYPDARGRAFPAIAQLLVEQREPATWARIAARKPAWIGDFIVSSCRRGVDPAHLVPLFLARAAQGRAGAEETACIVGRLRDTDRWQQAYHVWLNTLPRERLAEVGSVFNGSFEYAPSGVGFDWQPTHARERDSGHVVETLQVAGAAGKRALRVSYNGKRQTGIPIAQYLALEPGNYAMTGLARPQSITAGRGVQWVVRCVKAGKAGAPLALSERFIGSSEWRRFAFDVAVPADCPGQVLQLELAGASEGAAYLAGVAWFDELVLRRRG